MTIDQEQAALALDDIDDVVKRVKASLFYQQASAVMILWGLLVLIGYSLTYALPRYAGRFWMGLDGIGVLGTIALAMLAKPARTRRRFDWRFLGAILLFFGFGLIWSVLIGRF